MKLKKYFKALDPRKKIMKCPRCATLLRYPIKSNTTLRITCPKCHSQFDITFRNPFKEVFNWQKGNGFLPNMRGIKNRFWQLPRHTRTSMFIFFTMIIITSLLMFLSIVAPKKTAVTLDKKITTPKTATKQTLL